MDPVDLLGLDKNKLQLISQQVLKRGRCIICESEKVKVVALYIPDNMNDNAMNGSPQGHLRVAIYGLCDNCFKKSNLKEEIRKNIMIKIGDKKKIIDGNILIGENEIDKRKDSTFFN